MVKYVLVIREDVCSANGKDEAAINKLLEVAHKFGDVLRYEDCITAEINEREQIIANLKAQNAALSAVNLNDAEKGMVNAFRDCKAASDREYQAEIEKQKSLIEKVNNKFNLFAKQIKDCVKENETDK